MSSHAYPRVVGLPQGSGRDEVALRRIFRISGRDLRSDKGIGFV